ncbi:hypothetical protein BHE74_00056906 [Ensete ventricosum]|nr:hypothetical protein GW17_00025460 [Ensete ventricosum]RWW37915.1 hypothetical protein BHE74_00056906 [Ensete ventricosum]RZS27094.1 hypothetical protein BHM03_00060532 [Ensete ventricosum]
MELSTQYYSLLPNTSDSKSHGITPTFSTGCTVANACCVSRIIILLLPKHPDSKNKLVSAGFRCLLLLSYPPRVPAKDVSLCGKRGIRPPRVAPIFVAVACYPVVSDAANRHCVRSTTTPRFLRRDLSVKLASDEYKRHHRITPHKHRKRLLHLSSPWFLVKLVYRSIDTKVMEEALHSMADAA